MDGGKTSVDIGPKNRRNVTQKWRAVSPHPNAGSSRNDAYLDEKSVNTEKHSVSMEVGQSFMRFIKGKWGMTQAEIEMETKVEITFPSSRTDDFITIEGNSAESVSKASEKIQIIIDKVVNSQDLDYSHFISLPLAIHPELVDKLVRFQNAILASEKTSSSFGIYSGIEESIFINPKTFHITILMLKLWNKDRVKSAANVLQSVLPKVMDALENKKVVVRLKGLKRMKGSLDKARVLYAPVEIIGGEERLLRACQIITDAFVESGLVNEKDVQRKLKLHATVMNVRHRKREKGTRMMEPFNARVVFDMYGSEEWGEYPLREAHLSEIIAFDENGYYHCCASIPFPN